VNVVVLASGLEISRRTASWPASAMRTAPLGYASHGDRNPPKACRWQRGGGVKASEALLTKVVDGREVAADEQLRAVSGHRTRPERLVPVWLVGVGRPVAEGAVYERLVEQVAGDPATIRIGHLGEPARRVGAVVSVRALVQPAVDDSERLGCPEAVVCQISVPY